LISHSLNPSDYHECALLDPIVAKPLPSRNRRYPNGRVIALKTMIRPSRAQRKCVTEAESIRFFTVATAVREVPTSQTPWYNVEHSHSP
jgi:hypothetical protein